MLIRWTIYIIPIAGLLWIPGIIGLTIAPDATIFSIPLLWASIYFSVIWVGWFVSLLIGLTIPTFLRITLGSIAPELKHYIAYLNALPRYIALSLWSLSNWIVFIVRDRDNSTRDGSALFKFQQFVFAFFIDAVLLFVIKLLVQMIAYNFHRKSYEDRIAASKAQIRSLVRLYVHSRDVSNVAPEVGKMDSIRALKKALKEVKRVAQTTTTMFGTVASELAGERILQPNSPGSVVTNALSSTNKTRQLARRIFYSFVPAYRNHLLLEDIKGVFDTEEQAEFAFAQFDRDENGDASLEEVELACLDIHRERLALASSMRDLDSAVARLNSILVSVYSVVAIIIVLGVMNIGFNNLLVSAGTLILGLSWLIGSTAQEILSSIIFLFIKHPYDVSDRVDLDGVAYVVKEMSLLSTVFRQTDGKLVQIPHSVLNTKAVSNIRRSGPISETFVWNVEFGTSFEQIEKLREKMLEFLVAEKRDFLPVMDISIQNFEDQGKMTLGSDIKYKSNWQNGALKAQRRNKWICALKLTMASLKIYGPGGAGNPSPEAAATRVHLLQEDPAGPMAAPPRMPTPKFYPAKEASYSFADKREIFTDPSGDVFDEVERSSPPQPHVVSQQTAAGRVQEGTQRREFRSQ
ncbi:hypothetical protein BT69DRAFT_1402661 [Atractiella rhizophila]|nr:hypothetical protein BT69DRAFT_1402661 [Atractiella rhizophila]